VSDTDRLKLTAYFGERLRAGNRLLAEELLDLFAAEDVAASVVLRGIAGFGPRHQLRTDQTLSQSEDLPIAIAAVDTTDKITSLAARTVELTDRGLITLERTGTSEPTIKLSIYVGRQHRIDGRPAHIAVCDLLHRKGFACASVFLGVDGTVRGRRERARFVSRNIDVPVMIIAVGAGPAAVDVRGELERLLPDPLITTERVQLCKTGGRRCAYPVALPPLDARGVPLWQKLMVHTTEDMLHDGRAIHREIVERLRQIPGSRGATVLRGIWGFGDERKPHGDKFFQLGRQVPVTTIVVDSPTNIAAAFELIDQITADRGVITCERVPALVSIDGGRREGGTTLARFD